MKLYEYFALLVLLLSTFAFPDDDILIADFEQDSYSPWTTTGTAFGPGPAQGTLPNQMRVDGFLGKGLVNSYLGGDGAKGTLESDGFKIQRKFIKYLIGGGKNEKQLALQLLIDDQVVRTATGPNEKEGGSEALEAQYWDVQEYIGKQARIRIIDDATGSWGHINVDHIVQSNSKPKGFLKDVQRKVFTQAKYLHFPIKNGSPKRIVTVLDGEKVLVRNEMELAESQPDWWAPMDIESWHDKPLTIQIDKLPEDSGILQSIDASDTIKDAENLYSEKLRGQFHFSPRRGWNNDPNGCVYFNGEYHLFFQHNPYGWSWGNMHWGHAVSKDLVHWEELGDVLLPDAWGPMFSGSAVVDWKNTSGLGSEDKPPLVLFYTAAGNPTVQCMAYSLDGRTFTKYTGNPVVEQITPGNRDPKVIWHEPTKCWVMTLYVEWQSRHTIHFFTSNNLRDWKLTNIVRGDAPGKTFLFECPDFFELPVDGDPNRSKWVLMAANSDYAIGDFDGQVFLPDATRLQGHKGKDFYAAQSFSDVPDGRRILIGWWRTETKGMPFNQSMSLPLELKLTQTDDGPRMTFWPVKELDSLRAASQTLKIDSIKQGDRNPLQGFQAELAEIRLEFEPKDAKEVVLNIRDARIEYDVTKQELTVAGHRVAAPLVHGRQRLTIYCDRTGLEVFAADGLCYIPLPKIMSAENTSFGLECHGGETLIHSLEMHELRSAWK